MVHNPTCGCPNCFPINYPERFNPHSTYHVSNEKLWDTPDYSLWVNDRSTTFSTECWWCNENVYFHRNPNGGCVLFDSLGPPWPKHQCWIDHMNLNKKAESEMIQNRIKEQKSFQYKKTNNSIKPNIGENQIQGFIVGCDKKIEISIKINGSNLVFHYTLLRTEKGKELYILTPASQINLIDRFSYSNTSFFTIKRNNGSLISFLSKIEDFDNKQKMDIKIDFKDIIDINWTIRSNSK